MSDVKTVYRVLKHEGSAREIDRTLSKSIGSESHDPARLEGHAYHTVEELYRGETNPLPVLRFDHAAWKHHRAEMVLWRMTEFDPDIDDPELFGMLLEGASGRMELML